MPACYPHASSPPAACQPAAHRPAARLRPPAAQGVDARRILYLTFTVKMAQGGRQRLLDAGLPGAQRIECATLHSKAYAILRSSYRCGAARWGTDGSWRCKRGQGTRPRSS